MLLFEKEFVPLSDGIVSISEGFVPILFFLSSI